MNVTDGAWEGQHGGTVTWYYEPEGTEFEDERPHDDVYQTASDSWNIFKTDFVDDR